MAIDFLKKCYHHFKAGDGHRLTAIFFVGRGKRRHLEIPTGFVVGLAGAVGGAVVWALLSFGVLSGFWFQNRKLNQELKSLQEAMFDYQVRYEDVYEKAYFQPNAGDKSIGAPTLGPVSEALKPQTPHDELLSLTEELPGLSTKGQLEGSASVNGAGGDDKKGPSFAGAGTSLPAGEWGDGEITPEESAVAQKGGDYVEVVKNDGKTGPGQGMPVSVRSGKESKGTVPTKESVPGGVPAVSPMVNTTTEGGKSATDVKAEAQTPAANASAPLQMVTGRATVVGQAVVIPVNIKNPNQGSAVNGYLAAVATLQSPDGVTKTVVYPGGIALDHAGKLQGKESMKGFSVKKSWKTKIKLVVPSMPEGSIITGIKVSLVDAQGQVISDRAVPAPVLPKSAAPRISKTAAVSPDAGGKAGVGDQSSTAVEGTKAATASNAPQEAVKSETSGNQEPNVAAPQNSTNPPTPVDAKP